MMIRQNFGLHLVFNNGFCLIWGYTEKIKSETNIWINLPISYTTINSYALNITPHNTYTAGSGARVSNTQITIRHIGLSNTGASAYDWMAIGI